MEATYLRLCVSYISVCVYADPLCVVERLSIKEDF
jgi:hypothetical protein